MSENDFSNKSDRGVITETSLESNINVLKATERIATDNP
jgi:hypothetical protein